MKNSFYWMNMNKKIMKYVIIMEKSQNNYV